VYSSRKNGRFQENRDGLVRVGRGGSEKTTGFAQGKLTLFILQLISIMLKLTLFQVEATGKAFVGLAPKTYIVLTEDDKTKLSAKGVQKKKPVNKSEILTFKNYYEILHGRGNNVAFNIGFRPIDGRVYTYIQAKTAFSPLFIKRICNKDNFETTPLLI
jgi:hypothetical protein